MFDFWSGRSVGTADEMLPERVVESKEIVDTLH
jgi:hypothetical protein